VTLGVSLFVADNCQIPIIHTSNCTRLQLHLICFWILGLQCPWCLNRLK